MSDTKSMQQLVLCRIARRVRHLRSKRGLTQERLAQLAGLAPRHLQKIEAAGVNVTVDSLVKIAHALDLDVSQLLLEDRDPTA